MTDIKIDPFGFWPNYASAIYGLRDGATPRHPAYAFHTRYLAVAPGLVVFRVVLRGLRGPGGMLELRLQSSRRRRPGKIMRRVVVRLHDENDGENVFIIRFRARSDRDYAVHGRWHGAQGAQADAVEVMVDPILDDAMLLAKADALAAAPSRSRRRLVATGLVRDDAASLSDPLSQMCTAAQLDEPAYARWVDVMGQTPVRHRKQWEFVWILAMLARAGRLAPGGRGLGFGAGVEPLPSVFAARGLDVLASDMPADAQAAAGWTATNQHAAGPDVLWHASLVDRATFDARVRFRPIDMTRIPADLAGFDFCWSACAFEHLGSIARGLAFVERSLETLRPGGIAVHTTELNLSSDRDTIDDEDTVLFRWRDFEKLALRLARRGHSVLPIRYDRGHKPLDRHIDMPPYRADPHLKIALSRHMTTSFGFAVVRGT